MCGIAGIHVRNAKRAAKLDLTRLASNLLHEIDQRGGDATGALTFGPRGLRTVKASCRVGGFLKEWEGVPDGTWTTLLHTRFATQGDAAFPENNHPVTSGRVHVVHNGVIANDAQLFDQLAVERRGRVDSEAIPAVMAAAGWEDATAGLGRLDGAYAIAAVHEKHPGELLLAKAGWSPLAWYANDAILVWASEPWGLRDAWLDTFGGGKGHLPWPDTLNEGECLRVHGADLTHETFSYVRQKPAQVWAPAKPAAKPTVLPVAVQKPLNLACSVAPVEPPRPRGYVWDSDGAWLPEDADVRCPGCDELVPVREAQEAYGELVCGDCYDVLVDVR